MGFDISCKLSPLDTVCMKCEILFSGKIKKNISKCRPLKILPRMLSIKNVFSLLEMKAWWCIRRIAFDFCLWWVVPCENVSSGICGQPRPRSTCASAQCDQGLHSPLAETFDGTEYMNGEQRPEWYFTHAQDDLNLRILRMFEGNVSFDAALIMSFISGYLSIPIQVVTFIVFTDACIYWIHRFLHHKSIYKTLHKDHHKWKVPTPFASHAFHPMDGFLQSCPYHIYPFLFPLHKVTYLVLFVAVNFWTVSIHDGDYRVPDILKPFVNGSAHHMDHHLFYNYNYGQYFTLWDRIGGSFRTPSSYVGEGPIEVIKEMQKNKKEW